MNIVICHWRFCVCVSSWWTRSCGSHMDVATCLLPVYTWPTILWLMAAGIMSLWRSTAQPLDSPLMPATPSLSFCHNPASSLSPVGRWCWPALTPAQMQSDWASRAVWRTYVSMEKRWEERRGWQELARRPAHSLGSTNAALMWRSVPVILVRTEALVSKTPVKVGKQWYSTHTLFILFYLLLYKIRYANWVMKSVCHLHNTVSHFAFLHHDFWYMDDYNAT